MPIYLKQFTRFPNAGDVASRYVVSRLLGTEPVLSDSAELDCPNLVAIGSILHWADPHSTVWGAGLLSAKIKLPWAPARILAVRGQLTRARLLEMGIATPECMGDPGILISDLFRPQASPRSGVGIIPHYVDSEHPFVRKSLEHGATLIDPLSPFEEYLSALASCEVIISSSLHGIVFAHSYGIPAVWIKLSEKVLGQGFKFLDYYSAIGIEPGQVPDLNGTASLEQVVDQAGLPRSEIDRTALRNALQSFSRQLAGHNER